MVELPATLLACLASWELAGRPESQPTHEGRQAAHEAEQLYYRISGDLGPPPRRRRRQPTDPATP